MKTPETASSLPEVPVASDPASDVVASRPSQSPKLDRPRASHSRRNGVIASTARTSWSGATCSSGTGAEPAVVLLSAGAAAAVSAGTFSAALAPIPHDHVADGAPG